ncbi:HutD family protein [Pimelobacter simplex]|uniref:HutD family protein n=1 Tax=Nocardioides simplex TaxID=2045 RepID=A0A7J5DV04_NOCSI|nr:HutD family protein [Pimelobacter simplex]KAB2809030.1 HutD family protein [Pimelobacter simplex]
MSLTVRRDRDHRRQPWANGEGVTAEIATGPDGADPFDWRVSLADVERSSDFSAFPGIDRIITLVDGTAMELTLPDRTHVLRPDEPFAFDGGVPVRCAVDRPTRDLNVMTRRGRASASLQVRRVHSHDAALPLAAAAPLVVVVLSGCVRVRGSTGATLRAGDVALTDEPVLLAGDGRVALARIA